MGFERVEQQRQQCCVCPPQSVMATRQFFGENMKGFEICFAENTDLKQVAALSKKFEKEKCCNGIIADAKEFFIGKKVAVAKQADKIVGYAYGEFEIKNKDTSIYKKGQKVFYLEEIYVDKTCRNQKIGQNLCLVLEKYAKENGCQFFETTAVSKNYQKLLSFYINKMDMTFWSAQLIKKL